MQGNQLCSRTGNKDTKEKLMKTKEGGYHIILGKTRYFGRKRIVLGRKKNKFFNHKEKLWEQVRDREEMER